MGFILGFGQTEKEREREFEESILECAKSHYDSSEQFITERLFLAVSDDAQKAAAESEKQYQEFKISDSHPSRYASFRVSGLHNANYIVLIVNWMHINRCNPLSSDGWSCMTSRQTVVINLWDDLENDH